MKKLLFSLLSIVLLISCTAKARRNLANNSTTLEKVVILEHQPLTNYYKVKRISKGVVTYITISENYIVNDTIFHRFEKD